MNKDQAKEAAQLDAASQGRAKVVVKDKAGNYKVKNQGDEVTSDTLVSTVNPPAKGK
jgi:hypothetical protein